MNIRIVLYEDKDKDLLYLSRNGYDLKKLMIDACYYAARGQRVNTEVPIHLREGIVSIVKEKLSIKWLSLCINDGQSVRMLGCIAKRSVQPFIKTLLRENLGISTLLYFQKVPEALGTTADSVHASIGAYQEAADKGLAGTPGGVRASGMTMSAPAEERSATRPLFREAVEQKCPSGAAQQNELQESANGDMMTEEMPDELTTAGVQTEESSYEETLLSLNEDM